MRRNVSLATCERGTASVEIVIMLPVFILLFWGVMHIHSIGLARQQAQSAARGCAYHFAVNGCTDDAAAAPICAGIDVSKVGDIPDDAPGKREDTSAIEAVKDWPLVGYLVERLFGEGSRARSEQTAKSFVGDEDSKVAGRFFLVCNTVSQSWSGKLTDLVCGVAKKAQFDGIVPGC